MPFCHAVYDVGEVGFRVEAAQLGGFQHGLDDGGALATGFGTEEQVVFARDGDGAQSAFSGGVVDADAAVGGVEAQILPAADSVIDRFGVTWRHLLEELDRPALKPLPAEPYVFAEWRIRRVGIDYHVDVGRHYYSVPHRFAKAQVEARLTARNVEIFVNGERLAAHMRGSGNGPHPCILCQSSN